jgi:replicative DNA helicase
MERPNYKAAMAETDKKTRVPPNSKESEMMVLGCMLTSVNGLNIAADTLLDSDFYYNEHQILFSALKAAYCLDKPADIHLISEELKRQNRLDAVGGISYLTTLAQYAGTSAYIEEYVNLIREKSILRQMINASQKIEKNSLEDPGDVMAALDEAQTYFFNISQANQHSVGVAIKDLLTGVKAESKLPFLKELQERQQKFLERDPNEPSVTGVPTHFIDLDRLLNGFNPSNLMILAARPAMGKTALLTSIAENICFKNKIPVAIFSLEMSASQLLHRMICSQAEVESEKIQTGSLNGSEYQRIVGAVNMMQKHLMVIDDQPGLKITDLRARARRLREAYNIGFMVIDYLQLISGSGNMRAMENRQVEISEISRMLKNLARELNIPILCAAQLSRKVEERQGHRPMMSDLRESGCLSGDTLIKDADTGHLYTIKELAERREQKPIQVFAIDENLKLGSHKMTKVFASGKKTVYELKLRSGRKIKASANHRFRLLDGWKCLDELTVGSHLAIPCASEMKSTSLAPCLQPSHHNRRIGQGTALCEPEVSLESGVYWDEIDAITEIGVEDVYDATVPGAHNFVANDIVVHNSLEQDSDVVMFLLRREYYDPYDKPGLAEVIVAKNRHGAIGSVNLAFRKEIAQFANYTPINSGAEIAKANKEAFSAFSPED